MLKQKFSICSFLSKHINGGVILIVSALLAILVANSLWSDYYFRLFEIPINVQIGDFNFFSSHGNTFNLTAFINDGLMAIFFFYVGLEVKRETIAGNLSTPSKAALPIIAAIGGMIFPIIIYLLIANTSPESQGAPIPMATDIAFSLGVLSLLGDRIPPALKIFLTAFAVVDDIGGILVIALGYSTNLQPVYLLIAAVLLLFLLFANRLKVYAIWFYVLIGLIVWYMFLQSGIHSTIAGFLVALTIPARPRVNLSQYIKNIKECINDFQLNPLNSPILNENETTKLNNIQKLSCLAISPLQHIENRLEVMVNYFIMPLFAFANAGIVFSDSLNNFFGIVTFAVAFGLIIGKFTGILSFICFGVKLKIVSLPEGSNWKSLAGVAMLGGIGFTVSLFIANLAFGNTYPELLNQAKLGIVSGTVCSAIIGYIMLNRFLPKNK